MAFRILTETAGMTKRADIRAVTAHAWLLVVACLMAVMGPQAAASDLCGTTILADLKLDRSDLHRPVTINMIYYMRPPPQWPRSCRPGAVWASTFPIERACDRRRNGQELSRVAAGQLHSHRRRRTGSPATKDAIFLVGTNRGHHQKHTPGKTPGWASC